MNEEKVQKDIEDIQKMGYTVRQIFRIHDGALMEIDILESCHEMS